MSGHQSLSETVCQNSSSYSPLFHNPITTPLQLHLPLLYFPLHILLQLLRPIRKPPRHRHLQHHDHPLRRHRPLIRQHAHHIRPELLHPLPHQLLRRADRFRARRCRCPVRSEGGLIASVTRRHVHVGERLKDSIDVWHDFVKHELADPERQRALHERLVHFAVGDQLWHCFGYGQRGRGIRVFVESVHDRRLPGVHVFHHGAVGEAELYGYGAEGLKPGELAGGLDGFEGAGVAVLLESDGGGNKEGVGGEGRPEEAGEDARVQVGEVGAGELVVLLDEAVGAAGVENVFEHYFAGLQWGFAEADFEELENAGLGCVS